jgi:plastin-3
LSELKEALDNCGYKIPGWRVRQMIEEYDDKNKTQHRGRLSFEEFERVRLILLCINKIYNYFVSTAVP